MPVSRELNERAERLGLDPSENEKPGPNFLATFTANHAPGVVPRYIKWEEHTSVEEEARAEREHYSSLEEDMLTRLPQWDAEALLPSGDDELTSPFAQPAPMGDAGLGLSMWDGQQEWQQPQPANGDAGADAATSSKFCTQCGTKLPVDAKFCSACGAKQVSSS